ncbi:MAG: Gfo/Idh/MocA family protein [Acidimicrobiales bacterium]
MRLGLAGLGRMGAVHARNMQQMNVLSLVYDADPARAAAVSAATGADVADDPLRLFESGLDGVVVATTTPSHADLVEQALQAGLPILCEKPISTSLAESTRLVAAAELAGVDIQVGFQRRSDPELVDLRARVLEGAHGSLVGIRIVSSSWHPPSPEYLRCSGGLFGDKLAHELDLVRWLTGREIEEIAVTASGAATGWIGELGDADTASVSLLLTGGIVGQIWVARTAPSRFDLRVEVTCRERLLVTGSWDHGSPHCPEWSPSPWPSFAERFKEAYRAEIERFCLLVGSAAENVCPAADALSSEIAAAAGEESWRELRVVRVSELARSLGSTGGRAKRWVSEPVRPGRDSS